MAERYVAAHQYAWPFNGDLRPENTALIVIDTPRWLTPCMCDFIGATNV